MRCSITNSGRSPRGFYSLGGPAVLVNPGQTVAADVAPSVARLLAAYDGIAVEPVAERQPAIRADGVRTPRQLLRAAEDGMPYSALLAEARDVLGDAYPAGRKLSRDRLLEVLREAAS